MWTGLNFTYGFREGLALHILPEYPRLENLPGLLALRRLLTTSNAALKIEAGFLPEPAIFSGTQRQEVINLVSHLIQILETPGAVDFQGEALTLVFPFVAATTPEFSLTVTLVMKDAEPLLIFPEEEFGFETAFPDMSLARETDAPENLWAIHTSRLALKITGPALIVAPRPLSTELCGGEVTMPVMPEGLPSLPAALEFRHVDLDVWYRSFLESAGSASVAARESIAARFAGQLDWPFQPAGPAAALSEARDFFARAIASDFSAAYGYDAAVQYPVEVDPKFTLHVEMRNLALGAHFSEARARTMLTFLVGADDVADTKEIRIAPAVVVTGFEKDGLSMQLITASAPATLEAVSAPILLRQYPEPVQLVSQTATPTPDLKAESLSGVGLWEYSADYQITLTPHDSLGAGVAFNSPPPLHAVAEGDNGLFRALARFLSAMNVIGPYGGLPAAEALIQTLIDDVAAQSFPPDLSVAQNPLVLKPVRIAGLNVLQTESAIASFQVERNTGAAPGYIYRTPSVSFAAPAVPFLEIPDLIQAGTVGAMLKSLIGDSLRLVSLSCELQISLGPDLVTSVPVLLTGPVPITPAVVDEFSIDAELAISHAAHHSGHESGLLIFTITVYSKLAVHAAPLLKFTNLQRKYQGVSA